MPANSAIINIILQATDKNATTNIKRVESATRRLSSVTKGLSGSFVSFNRTLFTTTALLGTLALGIRAAFRKAEIGAEFMMLRKEFEDEMGKGFVDQLRKTTKYTVSSIDLMREGLLATKAGINKAQLPEFMGLVREASKMTHQDFAASMKGMSGAIGNLEPKALKSLGIFQNTNLAFRVTNEMLGKVAGSWSVHAKKAYMSYFILKELRREYGHLMIAQMDEYDILKATQTAFGELNRSIGSLILKSMQPFLAYIYQKIYALSDYIQMLADSNKGVQYFVKGLFTLAGAIGVVTAAVAILRLVLMPFGVGLWGTLITLGAMVITAGTLYGVFGDLKTVMEALGYAFQAMFESAKTYNKGSGKISKDTYDNTAKLWGEGGAKLFMNFGIAAKKGLQFFQGFFSDEGFISGFRKVWEEMKPMHEMLSGMMGITGQNPRELGAKIGEVAGGLIALSVAIVELSAVLGLLLKNTLTDALSSIFVEKELQAIGEARVRGASLGKVQSRLGKNRSEYTEDTMQLLAPRDISAKGPGKFGELPIALQGGIDLGMPQYAKTQEVFELMGEWAGKSDKVLSMMELYVSEKSEMGEKLSNREIKDILKLIYEEMSKNPEKIGNVLSTNIATSQTKVTQPQHP